MCFGSGNLFAQATNFFNIYGGEEYDYGQGIVQLPDSSYAVTGASGSFIHQSSQAFILRVDSLGNYLWSRDYGGEESDWGKRIFYRSTQGYWIAGYSNSYGNGDYDFFLLKTDPSGNEEWVKTYGTNDYDELYDAVLLPDSGFVMVGETMGQNSLDEDIYLVRTNFVGDTLWTKRIQTQNKDIAYTCLLQNDTTVLIGGISSEATSTKTAYLASININGTINWEKYYGTDGSAAIRDIDTVNNEIYLGGAIIQTDSTDRDGWKGRLDSNGNLLEKSIVYHHKDNYISTICIHNGAIYVTDINETDDFFTFYGGHDVFILGYSLSGFYFNNYSNSFSGNGPDFSSQSIRTSDGGMIVVGYATSPLLTNGGAGITLIKIGKNNETDETPADGFQLVGLPNNTPPENNFAVYPNPVSNKLKISQKIASSGKLSFSITDLSGKLIQQGVTQESINVQGLKDGIYFITLSNEKGRKTFKIIKN